MTKTVDQRDVIMGSDWVNADLVNIDNHSSGRGLIPFTSIIQDVPLHYQTRPGPSEYMICNDPSGRGVCEFCRRGWDREMKSLLPIFDVCAQEIGILLLGHELPPYEHRLHKLLPRLYKPFEFGIRLVLTIHFLDGGYEVSSRGLREVDWELGGDGWGLKGRADEYRLEKHLSQLQKDYEAGNIDLAVILRHVLETKFTKIPESARRESEAGTITQ